MAAVALAGCATSPTPEFRKTPGPPDVIAHRGASAYAPENTLAAFALAADLGADWFELDCTLTKDGAVIVIHDDTVDRVTNGTGRVAAQTLAALQQLDAGSQKDPRFAGERLPTLDAALELAKARRIGVYIEIKNSADDGPLYGAIERLATGVHPFTTGQRRQMMALIHGSGTRNLELTRKTIALVRQHQMEKQVVIQSFAPVVCAIVQDEAPEIRAELLAGKDAKHPENWAQTLRWLEWLRPAGFNIDQGAVEPALLAECHRRGITMAVWTVDNDTNLRRFAALGVDHLITNRPDAALKLLREMGKRPAGK